jgi:subtilase family serine protease
MRGFLSSRAGAAALLALVAAALLAASTAASASAETEIVYKANPPHVFVTSSAKPGAFTNPFCRQVNGVAQLICYSPSDIRTAYGYPSRLDGSGQTIVIIDAYGSPTIQSDLATFDAQFGLPAPPVFKIECPQGCPAFSTSGKAGTEKIIWAAETSLDVEWAHAMAPGAKIVLVVAATNFGDGLYNAERVAFPEYPGAIVSQSFTTFESEISGGGNQLQQAHQNYETGAALGDTVLAAADDSGATNGGTTENAGYPVSDPLVTAIGGTEGNPYYNGLAGQPLPTCQVGKACTVGLATVVCQKSGACPTIGYGGEQVWNEPYFARPPIDPTFLAATGGAESIIFSAAEAPFQSNDGLNNARRTTPDVSYNAAVSGGVLVHFGFLLPETPFFEGNGWYIGEGTSAGTPQWAAIVALANQARSKLGKPNLGYLNNRLYALAESSAYGSDFHDITVGNNQAAGTPFGYSAGPGYDIASGWGTPQVGNLVAALANG